MAKRSEPGANPKPDQEKARWTPFPGWQRVWIYLVVGGSLAVILVYLLIWRQMAGAVPIPSNITQAPALGLQAPTAEAAEPGTHPNPSAIPAAAPAPPVIAWSPSVVDRTSAVGLWTSLALDREGVAYIAYGDDDHESLKLAMRTGVTWNLSQVRDTPAIEGWHPSLAVDPAGGLHISYYSWDTSSEHPKSAVEYASQKIGGEWEFTPVASIARKNAIVDTSLAIDSSGAPYLVYFDTSGGSNLLACVYLREGQWETTRIGIGNPKAEYFPIAIDPQDQPHVVFAGETGLLLYASFNGGKWDEPQPIDGTDGALFPALAFDRQGRARVSFYDSRNGDLRYAVKESSGWQVQTVDASGNVGQYTALAVGADGSAHISYYDVDSKRLKYATNNPSGSWLISVIDGSGKDVGRWSSIAVGQDGRPLVSYYAEPLDSDVVGKELRFATAELPSAGQGSRQMAFAEHHNGQTFITWVERPDMAGEQYRVYRASEPVTADSLPKAQLLGKVGENSSRIWSNHTAEGSAFLPRLTDRFVIKDGDPPLDPGIGAFVWTLSTQDFGGKSSGAGYYAVTVTQRGGTSEVFLPEYATELVSEAVADPLPVEISYSTPSQPGPGGHYYLQYMDLRHWNPTYHAPNSANKYYGYDPADPDVQDALAYAYDYAVYAPTADLCGGSIPDTLPVMMFLHGSKANRYGNPEQYTYPYCAYGVYPIDEGDTWYFGFARSHDYRLNSVVEPTDVIENFTEQRILRMIYDLMRSPPGPQVDPQRIYLFGHSMGGSGSLAFAQRYPNVFAAIYSGQPVTTFRVQPGFEEPWWKTAEIRWGAEALNLPIQLSAPNNWAAHLEKYNGTGVFDWENLRAAFDPNDPVGRAGDEMVPFGVDHGTIDGAVEFLPQGQPLYPLLLASGRAWAGAVTEDEHHWSVFGWPLPNFAKVNDTPFYNFGVIRDETVPGFAVAAPGEAIAPAGPVTYNQTILWSASWNAWDGAPVDTPTEWRMSFCSIDPATQKCGGKQTLTLNITPRRLQRFAVTPGAEYRWEVIPLPGRAAATIGTVTADTNGVITILGVKVTGRGIRLRIWAE